MKNNVGTIDATLRFFLLNTVKHISRYSKVYNIIYDVQFVEKND